MNKDKLKLKHLFEVYKISPIYPTEEDILYEYMKGLTETNLLDEIFENKVLRAFSNKLPDGYSDEKKIMEYFIDLGFFEEVNRYKKTKGEIVEYKLIKNPW
jgi:hypothetical protein